MRDLPDRDVETLERAAEILEGILEEPSVSAAVRRSFDSLSVPNYRRYFAGQVVSLSGNWMQTVAEIWLILSLTGSGVAVGLTTALQFLPMLLFGAWGGLLADRFPKRRLLIVTQALMAIPALGLFAVTATGVVAPWMVYLAVFAMGAVNAVDNPTRQSFVIEMVGPDRVVNAVSLNSVIVQSARIVGPAIAGVLIAGFGVGPCFARQRRSPSCAMIFALWRMDPRGLHAAPVAARASRARSAPACATSARTPELAVPLALMALVGTFGFNFQVVLPLLARFSFGGGADDLRGAGLGDGGRLGRRGPRHRRPRPHRPAADRRRRARLRRSSPCSPAAMPTPGPRDPGAGRARRRRGHLRGDDQLDPAARRSSPRCGAG